MTENNHPSLSGMDVFTAFFVAFILVGAPFIGITITRELEWRENQRKYIEHQKAIVHQEELDRLEAIPTLIETVWSVKNFRIYRVANKGREIGTKDIFQYAVKKKLTICSPEEWIFFTDISAAGESRWPLYRPGRYHLAYDHQMLYLQGKGWIPLNGQVEPGTFILLKSLQG